MKDPREHHRYTPGQPHWWQWLTVLSLDAPLVALAWQKALADAAHFPLRRSHAMVLGASVWLAYAADRWIEGWRLDPEQVLTQRHWFYQRWRWPVAAAWLAVLSVALTVSFTALTRRELSAGLVVLGAVATYLLSHQLVHRHHAWRAPKEVCVALLLSAGVACFPAGDNLAFLAEAAVPLTLFGLLCFANCALISLWENEVDRSHGQSSLALQFPQGRPWVRALPWIIAVFGGGFVLSDRMAPAGATWCAVASGALLGGVDLAHRRLGRQLSRVLADIMLMTPFIPPLLTVILRPQ